MEKKFVFLENYVKLSEFECCCVGFLFKLIGIHIGYNVTEYGLIFFYNYPLLSLADFRIGPKQVVYHYATYMVTKYCY